jgi:acyl-CoA thioester hydrolase
MADLPPKDDARPEVRLFTHTLRVYWEDTDAGGVVFYANYLKFFERARTEWLRGLGIGQQALRERRGRSSSSPTRQVRYRRPARLDDLLRVTVVLPKPAR